MRIGSVPILIVNPETKNPTTNKEFVMKIVLARPFDDETIVEAYQVKHEDPTRDFEKDWEKEKEKAKGELPEEWDINTVIEGMESCGWEIKLLHPTTVTY